MLIKKIKEWLDKSQETFDLKIDSKKEIIDSNLRDLT